MSKRIAELQKQKAAEQASILADQKRHAVYVKHVLPQSGTKNDQVYDEIREFATLAFDWQLYNSSQAQPE